MGLLKNGVRGLLELAFQTYEARTKYRILTQDDSMPFSLSFWRCRSGDFEASNQV